MNAASQVLFDTFSRHLVALTLLVELPDGSQQGDACTCFVLDVRGTWMLVTAGHVIRGIQDLIAKGARIMECGLYDAWGNDNPGRRVTVPLNLSDAPLLVVDEENGLDVALIGLHEHQRRLLESNGIKGLNEHAWRDVPNDLDRYYVMGLPSQFMENLQGPKGLEGLWVSPIILPMQKRDAPAEMRKPIPRFYGQLASKLVDESGEELHDIDGMSGGPILGTRRVEGGLEYFLVAIQSAWRPDLRVAAGPFTSTMVQALEADFDRVSAEIQQESMSAGEIEDQERQRREKL
jgi:hypothetical protein